MSSEVKNFIRKIIFTVIAFAALCIFCFDMFGSTGNSHFGFLALLFPVLGVLEYMLPTPRFHEIRSSTILNITYPLLRNPVREGGISFSIRYLL